MSDGNKSYKDILISAVEVANKLKEDGITATVINSRFLKPFDEKSVLDNLSEVIVTIEDGTIVGGLGSRVEEVLFNNKINKKLEKIAYPDEFIKHGSVDEIEANYGLDTNSIVLRIKDSLQISKIKNIGGQIS